MSEPHTVLHTPQTAGQIMHMSLSFIKNRTKHVSIDKDYDDEEKANAPYLSTLRALGLSLKPK